MTVVLPSVANGKMPAVKPETLEDRSLYAIRLLYIHGLLSEAERARALHRWRKKFGVTTEQ